MCLWIYIVLIILPVTADGGESIEAHLISTRRPLKADLVAPETSHAAVSVQVVFGGKTKGRPKAKFFRSFWRSSWVYQQQ